MFDELARRGYNDHVLPTSCNIPAVLQKRLSLVPHRNSVLNQFCNNSELSKLQRDDTMSNQLDSVKDRDISNVNAYENNEKTNCDDEKSYSDCRLTPIRYNRRRNSARPLSGSSVASSTSSSGCSNQGNACTINPYLASVESLADTCASSQGSGDSGVVTVSESNCRIGNDSNSQRRNSADEDSPFHRPRYCDPHRNPVERVLLEIVDTEAIYVEHLRQVIEGYLIFWRNDPTTFVQQMQLSALFSNIEDIFEFNREFLKEIEKCVLDPVCIANTFIKHNSGFKVYTEYCTNYPRTVSVLTDLMGQEETASAFRERQAALGHALPLGSFLLKPVQRILKYHLLLENLSKEYGADCGTKEHEAKGRNAIEAALAAMTGIAKHINAMKRRHEHAVRVQEIQSLLYGWPGPDLTTSGELVAEGRFRMRGAKAPRHAFLFDRMLLLTKKKEDGLLVYKAHIMCSNLMLIESIPGEPFSFHVIPFDNPRLQYTLQARNLEQKREWTLQIKRVILENYNAVIPSHARQLVLQLGQTQQEDEVLIDKGSGKKQHSAPPEYLEKRKQERERRRSETGIRQKFKKGGRKSDATNEDSPASSRKSQNEDSNNDSREQGLRSSDGRTSKVKERFTGWRRKSEPGFQSYISLNQSDIEQKEEIVEPQESPTTTDEYDKITGNYLSSEIPDKPTKTQTVEEIVGHILMQNEEFQKLLEKQHINSIINVRKQRFTKYVNVESSDSDSENLNYSDKSKTKRVQRSFIRTNNTLNSLNQSNLQLVYDNLNNKTIVETPKKHHRHEEKKLFNKQPIITESKVIKTALSIRENSNGIDLINDNNEFGNYDNLENLWENYHENYNSPIKPSVWLNKLCEGLPTSRQKCGSLPRSFQMNIKTNENIKSRFLQRDGKPINDRPFTIASDKPAEINLEDMERYTTNYQNESRISKFPLTLSSTSTFFSSLDDTRSYNDCTTIHPDHKIYGNVGNSILKNVLSKTGINFLRNTMSTETLECNEEIERMKYFRKLRRKGKLKNTRESSSDVEEFVRCNSKCNIDSMLCYKQGSSDLGARIAQSDYADPMVLFSERRLKIKSEENIESETDSFYEKSFETIENFVDVDDTFRDSAIFSDVEDVGISVLKKCPPALPLKRRIEFPPNSRNFNGKPVVAEKPDYLKGRTSLFHKQFQCNRMKSECGVENVSRHDCDSRDDPTGIALKKQLDCDRTETQSGMEKASRDDCNESNVSTGIIKQRFYSSSVKPYSEVGNVSGDDCDERDVSIGSVFKKHLDRNETMSCKYVSTEIVTKKQFHCNQIDSESAINISRDNSDDRNLSTGIIFKKQFDSNEIKSDRNASTVCKKQFQCNRVNSERNTCDNCDERDVSAGQSQAGWVKKIVGQLQGEL